MSNINEVVNDFNEMLLSLANNLAEVCPNSIIGTNINDINKMIKNKTNFYKFIDLFTIKVLPYKVQIDAGDEGYFMKKDYESDLNDSSESTLNSVISLKSVWKTLKQDNKEIVIFNMQCLCALAQDYFEHVKSTI